MSIQFNDTSNLKGLVQLFEREIGDENGGSVSGNVVRLKKFTADVNLAIDDFLSIALPASGTWQLDDSNHTDYPIIKANIVSGQSDYPFTSDETGNMILDIYKVLILPSASATSFVKLEPRDEQSQDDIGSLASEDGNTGTPNIYGKTANGIFLDPKPNYSVSSGLKVYINREASYFTYTDTTKKPGFPGNLHSYFYLKPALEYQRRNNMAGASALFERVILLESQIKEQLGRRSRDERPRLSTLNESNK